METHIWLWKYTFLFMSGYGHDESAPTPNGLLATHFTVRIWYIGVVCKAKTSKGTTKKISSHSTLEDKKMKEKSFKLPLTSVYFFTIFLPLTIYMPFGRRFMLLDSRRPSNENTPCCAVFVLVSSVVSMP
mgnify:CR=1 FL=1